MSDTLRTIPDCPKGLKTANLGLMSASTSARTTEVLLDTTQLTMRKCMTSPWKGELHSQTLHKVNRTPTLFICRIHGAGLMAHNDVVSQRQGHREEDEGIGKANRLNLCHG